MNYKHLTAYRKAKESVQDWVIKFSRAHSENQNFKDFAEKSRTETLFFNWYQNEGSLLETFESYKILETTYNDMFDDFDAYLEILEAPEEKSFFGSKKKRRLNSKAKSIKNNSKKLIEFLSMFGSVIGNLVDENSDNEIEEYANTELQEVEEVGTSFEIETSVINNENITDEIENNVIDEVDDISEELYEDINEVVEDDAEYSDATDEETDTSFEIETSNIIEDNTLEDEDYEEEDNSEDEKALEDEIQQIRKKMEEEFQQKLKDLGL